MVKIYKGEASLFDLAAVGRTPGVRTAVTPWQMDGVGLVRYVGASAPWKGLRIPGAAGKAETEIAAIVGPHGALATGIKKIASTAKKAETIVGGAALGTISGTDYKGRPYTKRGLVPLRALKIAAAHGKTVSIERTGARYTDVIKPVPVPTVVVPSFSPFD